MRNDPALQRRGTSTKRVMKVSAAILVAAAIVSILAPTPEPEQLGSAEPVAEAEPLADGREFVDPAVVPAVELPAPEALRENLVAEPPPGGDVTAATGTQVLRVVLEGITEEDAQRTTVTVSVVDEHERWPPIIRDPWPCQGLTSEFDLDPFFASEAERDGDLRLDELVVTVDHPQHLLATARVPLSHGVEREGGQTVYEVLVKLVPGARHVFWPELSLSVRDAHTREHLEHVELRIVPTAFMPAGWERPMSEPFFTTLGGDLSSPIVLLGGRETDGPEDMVAGLALQPAVDEAPELFELIQPEAAERGVVVHARAPGHAWGSIVIDVSTGAHRELLLGPAAALDLALANVQLEAYAEHETQASINVTRKEPDEEESYVWHQQLDETLEHGRLLLDGLRTGEFTISVELGGSFSWKERPVLAREQVTLAAGETRQLVLALADPPAVPERATLGGVVSLPSFGGEEEVRLLLFEAATYWHDNPEADLPLADMERVAGALPTWSFRLEDLPVGRYQAQLHPLMANWMFEFPDGGREDVEFVIPQLAEVVVETVDEQTGERIPLDELRHGNREVLPDQLHKGWVRAGAEEPGRFRFWMAPGAAYVSTLGIPSGLDYGGKWEELELVPGLQSVRLELAPDYAIRFEFRVDGAALPRDDGVWEGVTQGIRAVGHEGRVSGNRLPSERLVNVSAPGIYEVSFEGIGTDRFLPTQPRLVDVRAGETAELIVELLRK
jgi:hypothetical protein